ncbi:MAG: 4'-phosphopantetheinyl transferase superfamily protein [Verrucomicrobiales bacterium]|nr:4'-phosphopantetheinyl transferase superfamily protein [Verrucomicrobiales bacterium]
MLPLAADEIEVVPFLLDTDDSVSLSEAESWLSPGEQERAAAFRFPVHRDRYIRGRGMVRKVLSEHTGEAPGSFGFSLGERGKPYLQEGELHFNLSHSEEYAVFAVSKLPSVGIDIERFDRKVDVPGLSKRCFRPSETERIERMTGEEKIRAFFWTWTAKEARMKATGEGFGLEPKKIEISFGEEHPEDCLHPIDPKVYLNAVSLPGWQVACTLAATHPFRVRLRSLP